MSRRAESLSLSAGIFRHERTAATRWPWLSVAKGLDRMHSRLEGCHPQPDTVLLLVMSSNIAADSFFLLERRRLREAGRRVSVVEMRHGNGRSGQGFCGVRQQLASVFDIHGQAAFRLIGIITRAFRVVHNE